MKPDYAPLRAQIPACFTRGPWPQAATVGELRQALQALPAELSLGESFNSLFVVNCGRAGDELNLRPYLMFQEGYDPEPS